MDAAVLDTVVNPIGTFLPTAVPGGLSECYHNGVLIDRRNGTPMEMDGYSLYLALKALDGDDGQSFIKERRDIVAAMLKRLKQCNGFFTHGAWTSSDEEIHFRFTATAVRLLEEAWRDGLCNVSDVRNVLEKHVSFVESLPIGFWFLHDSLELEKTSVSDPAGPTRNHAWGSSLKNCMVLNTHLDTLATVIYCVRSGVVDSPDVDRYIAMIRSGLTTLKTVLVPNKSLEWRTFSFFDGLFRAFIFSLSGLPAFAKRKMRGILRRTFVRVRKGIRSKIFGFQFTDGYIERDISLWGTGYEYHIVNVYDLLRLVSQVKQADFIHDHEWPLDDWISIADKGIGYAVRRPYYTELMNSIKDGGRAIYLCEAMLLRFSLGGEFDVPDRWVKTYCRIRKKVPPTAAILGYDPFVVGQRSLPLGDVETVSLLDGRVLNVHLADEVFSFSKSHDI